jgi:hypothetical protein
VKRQTLYRNTGQKLVLKTASFFVAATQNFPTQARFQHKSDFEHKNFMCAAEKCKMIIYHQHEISNG